MSVYVERTLEVGELSIDLDARWVRVAGETVTLTNKEYALLLTLAERPTRVFTREELTVNVWHCSGVYGRTVDSHASRLRQKLSVAGNRFIINVWGVGYRLTDPVGMRDDR